MAHHHAAMARDDAAERGQLGGLGIDARDIFEAVAEAEGARAQLGVELGFDPGECVGIGAALRILDVRGAAQRAVAGERGDVEIERRALGGAHPAAQVEVVRDPRAAAVDAERDRGDAHGEEALIGIAQRIAMGMGVDEAGGEHAAIAFDHAGCGEADAGERRDDGGDAVAVDEDIGGTRGGAGAVDQRDPAKQRRGGGLGRGAADGEAAGERAADELPARQMVVHARPL